jgi:hypothetical protein
MAATLIIIGSFLTAILIFAGVKALSILSSKEKHLNGILSDQKDKSQLDSDYILVKRDVLLSLIVSNENLRSSIEGALSQHRNEGQDLNILVNENIPNSIGSQSNVEHHLFNYEKELN